MKHRILGRRVVGVLLLSLPWIAASARELTFDDRIAAQRAIESVYWRHRIWPEQNEAPRPSFERAMTDATLRSKVETYLRESNALGVFWGTPIRQDMLQAEMDRMARDTKQPELLRELFAALDDDPFRIAECLARPVLADRRIREAYAAEPRIHGDVRSRAQDAIVRFGTTPGIATAGGEYRETVWRLDEEGDDRISGIHSGRQSVGLSDEEWSALQASLDHHERVTTRPGDLADRERRVESFREIHFPVLDRLVENEDGIERTSLVSRDAREVVTATVRFAKVPFAAWWAATKDSYSRELAVPSDSYGHPRAALACVDDTWSPTRFEPPDGLAGHASIWTGTEMIVIGGHYGTGRGYRYVPATDTWTSMSPLGNAHDIRPLPTAVWTGTEVIVWGGTARDDTPINTGGRYDPVSDTWTPTSTGASCPSPRYFHRAIWTGTQMVVWGGNASYSTTLNTGGRYDPATDTWTATSTGTNCPTGRSNPAAVWTGSRMIVHGGASWARYDPATDAWEAMAAPPVSLIASAAIWTGSVVIVWGGSELSDVSNQGGRYDPATNSWALTSTGAGVPTARTDESLVWTGTEMIVWGGWDPATYELFDSGARYDPATNTWTTMTSSPETPEARWDHSAVWTGSEMVVWGGFNYDYSYEPINTGGRYDPKTDTWTPTRRQTGIPTGRVNPNMAWTGAEMVLWGGWDGDNKDDGWFYVPALDAWSRSMATANVPLAGIGTSTVWTGTEMIVWGGNATSTGGRYDPVVDSWTPTSTGANVPSARFGQATVWTGREMILWGGIVCSGCCSCSYTSTGARYDPSADAWTPTSTGANVPTSRHGHTAVWTGEKMIVWGGRQGVSTCFNTGGRYDPTTDSWEPTSVQGSVPTPRESHGAVWTGGEMIVWGGQHLWDLVFNDGARYDPVADTWTSMSAGPDAPSARADFASVWTGKEMLVWGGWQFTPLTYESGGGRYDPALDRWTPIALSENTPPARAVTDPLWTGDQMIVWGGIPETASGGMYCAGAACEESTWYRDADADGFGNPADSVSACAAPDGYVADGTDCDDSSAPIHPGADEVCNGLDDDCDGAVDEGVLPLVTIDAIDPTASEPGADLGAFRVTRAGCDGRILYVHYTVSGSAKPGRDYKRLFGEVLIRSDRTSSSIVVRPRDDTTAESEESVVVTLVPAAEYVVGVPASATVIVLDDDASLRR